SGETLPGGIARVWPQTRIPSMTAARRSCPISKSATSPSSTTRPPERSRASRASASTSRPRNSFASSVPRGCGKSTLLNIIAGFLVPTAGEIRIGGKAVSGHGPDRGVVFQDFAQLFPWRTALGNVTFGLEMRGVGKAEREQIALAQLKLVKLEKFVR